MQAKNPARFLTYEQAFIQLVGACHDGTDTGLRDELVIRLGLSGMRCNEIATIPVSAIDTLPELHWIGKGNRPRRLSSGPAFSTALIRWMELRRKQCPPSRDDALLLPNVSATCQRGRTPRLDWHSTRTLAKSTIWTIITTRASQAGLGHVAPHDLRRSCASILHKSVTTDGAHRFDLLDIQRVLGHADPATTMRSYLEPMDSEVCTRAAQALD